MQFTDFSKLNLQRLPSPCFVEQKFDHLLSQMQWVNFGGGHHISA
jgi:diaminopimelate decarboxylase